MYNDSIECLRVTELFVAISTVLLVCMYTLVSSRIFSVHIVYFSGDGILCCMLLLIFVVVVVFLMLQVKISQEYRIYSRSTKH